MTQFGPPQAPRDRPPKPRSTLRPPKGSNAGRGGKKGGAGAPSPGRQDRGRSAPPPLGGSNALQQLASRVQQQGEGPVRGSHGDGGRRHAKARGREEDDQDAGDEVLPAMPGGRVPRRDMLSLLAELLGAPQLAAYQKAGWALPAAAQQQQPEQEEEQQWPEDEGPAVGSSAVAAPQPAQPDFRRRNMARLGGEGVASIFGADQETRRGGAGAGSAHKTGQACTGFMSALQDLKPGLSDVQRERQAAQREQLKRDLEEQMRQKKEAEERRKAALAAQEEREEAELRAYWAAQARGEQGSAAPSQAPGRGAQQGGRSQQQQQQQQPAADSRAGNHKAAALPAIPATLSPPGGARRGEALVQPGITVFLPPDKEAERRGALRARLASQSHSEEAESNAVAGSAPPAKAVHRRPKELTPAAEPDSSLQALLQQAAASGLLAAQQQQHAQALPLLGPAQAAALLAAANPALMAAAAAGLPTLYPIPPQLPPGAPAQATQAAAAGLPAPGPAAATGSDPQVLALLRELAQEQQRMREQFAAQLDAVSRLSGDASAARSERDRARQDLERVQRLLAAREQQGTAALGHYSTQQQLYGSSVQALDDGGDLDMLSVTTHVLPLGVGIPSRLGTPAGRGLPPAAGQREARGAQAALPARHRQQAAEPWQAQPQGNGRSAPKPTGRSGAAAGAGRLGQPVASKSRSAGGSKAAPAGGRGTWRK